MDSKPINLSPRNVLELQRDGHTVVVRTLNRRTDPEQVPETAYPVGTRAYGREAVSARKKVDTRWYYRADDGQEPGRYWLPNYLMPPAACRFELEVRSEDSEYIGDKWVARTEVWVAGPRLYLLDFEQIRTYNQRTRGCATLPARVLDLATDPTLRDSAFVRGHEVFSKLEWILPLTDREVRWWLRKVRFQQPPFVVVKGQEMPAGKEVTTE